MSSLIYPVLPGLTFQVLRFPEWKSDVQKALSGKTTSVTSMLYPIMHFELNYSVLRDTVNPSELKALAGLFNAMQGRAGTFLFTDPDFNTFSVANAQLFATGDGVTTVFQLTAFYANPSGGEGYSEIIQALNGTPVIYDNGVSVGAGASVNSFGVCTFTSAPASGHLLSWSGSFYYRCSFAEDRLELTKFMLGLWKLQKVKLTQVIL